jgi:hypothetical protein
MNPPVAGDQDESIASALMGLHLDPMQSTSGTGNNVYIASGDARQIAGPVSTTFTGPIEKVEAFFTGSADEDRRRQDWLRILRWLAPVNQSKVHNTAKRDRQPKTGIWFIDGPEFNQWLVNPASLIWLHGSGAFYPYHKHKAADSSSWLWQDRLMFINHRKDSRCVQG